VIEVPGEQNRQGGSDIHDTPLDPVAEEGAHPCGKCADAGRHHFRIACSVKRNWLGGAVQHGPRCGSDMSVGGNPILPAHMRPQRHRIAGSLEGA
jgi:hypothetical protein